MDLISVSQLLGNLGEFVGAIAVVATLIYLTVQVRQNTAAVRRQSYAHLASRRHEIFNVLAGSPELADIAGRGFAADELTPNESQRFTYHFINHMYHYQDCYLQHRMGIVEDEVWEAEKNLLAGGLSQPGFIDWWNNIQDIFIPAFVEEVANIAPVNLLQYDAAGHRWHRDKGTIETSG